ncbi:F-box protein At5g07610-like [Phoenix dactylifera]|uniref:F-box protein At5g07610-like n=1 Tax=Phoenix dactylifera TaxID=42345 RepID=A0A8B8ZAW5_PHODC|nr:F-box protein At5g07610-like [Phoenix dactylifera]XP_026658661.2 F-box protein At5g07610-like [Phoenix dactylifera]XP_038970426.1 F-box protein At5g07610-like [Phoenix dactylifera]XP_038970427.1 F-box protein At5g07610-like [Phoenix dactylifera]
MIPSLLSPSLALLLGFGKKQTHPGDMESDDDKRPRSGGGEDDSGADYALAIQDIQRRLRRKSRDRLRGKIADLLRLINTPLADIIRDHALPYLPAASVLRFRSVSASWSQRISSPLFAVTQSRCHRSISGLFCSAASLPSFAPFDPVAHALPDPSLSFLPSSTIVVRSSSNGLLCCFTPFSRPSYFVCNPATADWTAIPPPPLHPGADPALALIFEPSVPNLESHYAIVIAFQIDRVEGVYGFQTFSSAAGSWWVSAEVCVAECIIADSGVSAGGAAYWRTTMQTVVGYDPSADAVKMAPWPAGYEAEARWELGEMAGRLCCAAVTPATAAVYALGPSDRWSLLASFDVVKVDGEEEEEEEEEEPKGSRPIVFKKPPQPLRFQSGNLEALFWLEGRVVGVDLAGRRVRAVKFDGPQPAPGVDYVSHINTLAPVVPQVASTSAAAGPAVQGEGSSLESPKNRESA